MTTLVAPSSEARTPKRHNIDEPLNATRISFKTSLYLTGSTCIITTYIDQHLTTNDELSTQKPTKMLGISRDNFKTTLGPKLETANTVGTAYVLTTLIAFDETNSMTKRATPYSPVSDQTSIVIEYKKCIKTTN